MKKTVLFLVWLVILCCVAVYAASPPSDPQPGDTAIVKIRTNTNGATWTTRVQKDGVLFGGYSTPTFTEATGFGTGISFARVHFNVLAGQGIYSYRFTPSDGGYPAYYTFNVVPYSTNQIYDNTQNVKTTVDNISTVGLPKIRKMPNYWNH